MVGVEPKSHSRSSDKKRIVCGIFDAAFIGPWKIYALLSAFRKASAFAFVLHPTEIGAHFVRQSGQTVQKLGVVTEHLIILRFLVYDIVIDFAPAFLEQGSALDLYIIPLVFDGIVQRTVDAGGDNVDLVAVIDLGITGALVRFGTFCNVVMIRIIIKVIQPVIDILVGMILKPACNIAVEVNPILPI